MTLARTLALFGLSCLLLACPKKKTEVNGDAAVVSSDAGRTADARASETGSIDPLAQKLCAAFSEMPEKKRATCCSVAPDNIVAVDCARVLTAAIREQSAEIVPAEVDACVAAFEKSLEGCDWVGPSPPTPPRECLHVVKGLVGEGAPCRSSLECMGSLHCFGVGPTTVGKCLVARPIGEVCGGTIDPLATFLRQNDVDTRHPECATGHCIRHHCATPLLADEVCHATLDCANGLQCLPAPGPVKKGAKPERKCAHRPLPTREGEACPGGVCAGDLQCIMNKCARRKKGGEACTSDLECRGGCIKVSATSGTCGPRCDAR